MSSSFLRHLLRRIVRRGLQPCSPIPDRLLLRLYCSRFNGVLRWLMAGAEPIAYGGVRMQVNPAELLGFTAYFNHRGNLPEVALLVELCRDAAVFADIGANIGLIALPVAARSPGLEVFAFEPDPRNARMLAANLAMNPALASRIHPVAKAAAKSDGTVFFHSNEATPGNSRVVPAASEATCSVAAVRLDDYFTSLGRYPDVLKIDVEGGELEVLCGLSMLFERHPPRALLIEVHAFASTDPAGFKTAIRDLLATAGYRLYHPYDAAVTPAPWDSIALWPDHFSLLARHGTAAKP
jgi:FkbM family methyltransferase